MTFFISHAEKFQVQLLVGEKLLALGETDSYITYVKAVVDDGVLIGRKVYCRIFRNTDGLFT